jgi:RHS repeat-associated protein
VLTDTYDYEAFGEVLNETGTTDNNYKFTGEQFDSSLDQYYLRARYYDQGVGRFTQQDTWMGNNYDPVSLHKYLYGNADPVTYTDPSGNYSISEIGATLRINGGLAGATTSTAGRSAVSRLLTGAGKYAFGLVGEEIISLAKQSLVNILLAESAGVKFASAATRGSAAHQEFEKLIKGINEKYKKYGLRIAAEVFRIEDGGVKVKGRKKGSLGIDVAILSTKTGKTILAFDLKTGRGGSKKRNGRLSTVFDGANIIEILVSKKKK